MILPAFLLRIQPILELFSEPFAPTGNPKNWKSGVPPRDDALEIGPERRRFRRLGVGMPRPKRSEKLRIWRSEAANRAGVGVRRRGIPGRRGGGAAGFQVFRISESGRWGIFIGGPLSTHKRRSGFKIQGLLRALSRRLIRVIQRLLSREQTFIFQFSGAGNKISEILAQRADNHSSGKINVRLYPLSPMLYTTVH